jgi:hypothetical protein
VVLCKFTSLAMSKSWIETRCNRRPAWLGRGNTFRHPPQMLVVCLELLHHVLRVH